MLAFGEREKCRSPSSPYPDRASQRRYEDLSGPAIEAWLKEVITSPYETVKRIIPDGMASVRDELIRLCDDDQVDLILTTGGTRAARATKRLRPCARCW